MADLTMTPGAWLEFLMPRLQAQIECIRKPIQYFNGEHKLQFATVKFREAFSRYYPPMANNWMKLVVNAPAARLEILGFRFNPDPAKPKWDQDGDTDAWTMWQKSNMDSGSGMVHIEAIKVGVGYVMVIPADDADDEGWPRFNPELAQNCYVYRDPGDRTQRLAGIKRWVDDVDGYAYCNVFLADGIHKWSSKEKLAKDKSLDRVQWVRTGDEDNPIGEVPLIPIENKPDLEYGGRSDLEEAMPLQDAINKECLDMMVSSEFNAYPQRYATGWERAKDKAGNVLSDREVELRMGITRLIRAASKETSFGQFTPGVVDNYIKPIDMLVEHMAAETQTPAYYLKGAMANLSADAMHAADTGLVDRCRQKILLGFSDGWEDAIRCGFKARGDMAKGNADRAEIIWRDPERRSISQVIDAAVKMRNSLNVPIEMCWEVLGWTPEQIRMARDLMNLPPGGPKAAAGPAVGPDGLPLGESTVNPATGRTVDQPLILGPGGQPIQVGKPVAPPPTIQSRP